MEIKTTREYFNKNVDELLEVRNNEEYTREHCLLLDEGLEVVFFDDKKEMEEEKEEFNQYIQSKKFEIKVTLLTLNERIAVVLI